MVPAIRTGPEALGIFRVEKKNKRHTARLAKTVVAGEIQHKVLFARQTPKLLVAAGDESDVLCAEKTRKEKKETTKSYLVMERLAVFSTPCGRVIYIM